MLFSTPGTCDAESQIYFLTAQLQMSKLKSLHYLETIPPFAFIYATELSNLKSSYMNT